MPLSEKTLVILSPGFPGSENESTCLPAQQIFVKALKKNFPELNIIVLAFQYPYFRAGYDWYGIRVFSFNGRNKGKAYRLFIWISAWKMLKKLRKENNIIGLLSFWCTECALVGKYFGKKYTFRHLCWILGQDALEKNYYVRLIRPRPDNLVAISAFVAESFKKYHGIAPGHIIPNGIETGIFPEMPSKKDIDICGAGSLIPLKQYDVFVDIISGLKKDLPSIKAVLCGKGEEREKLFRQIEKCQLQENIELAGEKEHEEVLNIMQRSRVFLHTSRYEGYSTVCLEALYAGAHVISFISPGEGHIPNWHVVHTEQEMLQKALEILSNPLLTYERVCAHTMDTSAKSMMALFQ